MSPAAKRILGVRGPPAGVGLRPATEADHALVLSSWLRSFRPFASTAGPVYDREQHALIKRLLARGSATVAHPEGDDWTVLGYSVAEGSTLHYAYVKGELRSGGLGRMLLPAGLTAYTHQTPLGLGLCRGLVYNPYLR